jgi:heat shock protein HtpX
MASLYTQADSNTRKSWLLLAGFFVFIIALGYLFSYILQDSAILYVAVILSVIMSFGSYWWSDKIVLSTYGAKPIEEKNNPDLYHVVENLCITAGLPVPRIYVVNEMQPNAFATGRDKNHAVVCVTQGLLDRLNKTELQGVIAHELSHIGNKDMLLTTLAAVMAGIIALLANFFMRISFWEGGRRDSRDNNMGAILMVGGILAAILAPIAATLLQLAISRKREFLADEDGALLTRYPEGLASALEKIANDPTPMKITNDATTSLFIESPYKGQQQTHWFTKLFMTHPPIQERIRLLRQMDVPSQN